jgi:CHASE2 domain-containing sensor protein
MINDQIGHYQLIKKLGAGGMGVVWLAEDLVLKRLVALKTLPISLSRNADERNRLLSEARIAAQINHPNIAQVHVIEEVEDQLLFVMEYVDSGSIQDRLAQASGEPIPLPTALDWARQAAEGLAEAHHRGVIHGDIKPDNLMLDSNGWVKITDFGLAKVRIVQGDRAGESTAGTIGYQSPEVLRGDEVDPRSDLFSLGVTLYELLIGVSPFWGPDADTTNCAILAREPEEPSAHRPELPKRLDQVVLKLLRKEPEERYVTAAEVAVDLIEIQMSLGLSTDISLPARPGVTSALAQRLKDRLWWRKMGSVGAGLLAGIIVALFSYYLLPVVFDPLEAKLYDERVKNAVGVYEDIDPETRLFLIRIDDRALDKLGRYPQWPRSRHGTLARQLAGWGAKVVFLDLMFSESDTEPENDRGFGDELAEAGIVVAATQIVPRSSFQFTAALDTLIAGLDTELLGIPVGRVPNGEILPDLADWFILRPPIAAVRDACLGLGLVNLFPDEDHIIRRQPLLVRYGDLIIPSAALRLFMEMKGIRDTELSLEPGRSLQVGQYHFPVDSWGRMLLRWYRDDFAPFREISYYDVGRVGEPEIAFDGAICIVGSTALGWGDSQVTSKAPDTPGPQIHATILANLIRNEYGRVMGREIGFLLTVVFGILAGYLAMRLRIARGGTLVLILLSSYVVAAWLVYWRWTYWVELLRPSLGLLVGYLSALAYRWKPLLG